MTGEQLRQAQRQLAMNNADLCQKLGISEGTLCNWKSGRITVPTVASLAIKYLLDQRWARVA